MALDTELWARWSDFARICFSSMFFYFYLLLVFFCCLTSSEEPRQIMQWTGYLYMGIVLFRWIPQKKKSLINSPSPPQIMLKHDWRPSLHWCSTLVYNEEHFCTHRGFHMSWRNRGNVEGFCDPWKESSSFWEVGQAARPKKSDLNA